MITDPNEVAAVSVLLKNEYPGEEIRDLKKRFKSFYQAYLREAKDQKDWEKIFAWHQKTAESLKIGIIPRNTKKLYPLLLKEIACPPQFLFVRGNHELLNSSLCIAVVGTRKISEYGERVLREIIPPLVKAGAVIVSGLAFGVDGKAHEITLQHGGKCIAVFGCGVNEIYPKEHRSLAQRILENGGALISELPPGESPRTHHFPARNRIISGLSKATIIVEAKKKSGSLITAQFALDQNRDVFAVPGSIFSENQEGTNHLILEGAIPLVSKEELLVQLNLAEATVNTTPVPLTFDSREEELLFEALREPRSIDELKNTVNLDLPVISQFLSLLELKGLVKNYGNTRYGRM